MFLDIIPHEKTVEHIVWSVRVRPSGPSAVETEGTFQNEGFRRHCDVSAPLYSPPTATAATNEHPLIV